MDSKYFMDLDLDLDLLFQINANPNPRIQVHAALHPMVDLEHKKEVMAKELGTINIALALDCVKLLTWILKSNSPLGNYMF